MLKSLRSIASPLVSLIFIVLATAYFVTFSTLGIKHNGFSDHIVGMMHSGYYAGMLLSSFICQAIIQRIGHIRSFIFAATVSAISMLLMAYSNDPWNWISMRSFAGGCMGLIYIVIESWLLAYSHETNRGQILAIYTITLYAGQAFGQYFIDFIPESNNIPYLSAALITLLGIIPFLWESKSVPQQAEGNENLSSWLGILRQAPYGIIGSAVSGIMLSSIYSFTPIFAESYAISAAVLMSVTIFGGVFLQWPLGKLSDSLDRQNVLTITCLATCIPCVNIFLFPDNYWSVLANSFLLGGLAFTVYPQSIALVTIEAPKISFTTATAVALLTYGIGSMLGPLAVPEFTSRYGSATLYLFIALTGVIFAAGGFGKAFLTQTTPIKDEIS